MNTFIDIYTVPTQSFGDREIPNFALGGKPLASLKGTSRDFVRICTKTFEQRLYDMVDCVDTERALTRSTKCKDEGLGNG